MAKHLWEVDHPYYCNKGNYFASGTERLGDEHKTWGSFIAAYDDADFDLNLLFRWDWQEPTVEQGEGYYGDGCSVFNGDVNYRNGKLLIFWMGQRKGLYRWTEVSVCRADEPAVIAFLKPRWEHMRRLWEGISDLPTEVTP